MVRHGVCDDPPACLDRLEFRRIRRCPQHTLTRGFGAWLQTPGGSGSQCLAACVQCGLSQVRRPGHRMPGQPGTALCLPTLGRGERVCHPDIVGRGMVQEAAGVGGAMREPWRGKPRRAMLPVHVPVIIPGPVRGLQAPCGPWEPSCDRHGLDNAQPWPLARWLVAPWPLVFQRPGKRPCMVLVPAGLREVYCRPWPAALGGAMRSWLTPVASPCQDHIARSCRAERRCPRPDGQPHRCSVRPSVTGGRAA